MYVTFSFLIAIRPEFSSESHESSNCLTDSYGLDTPNISFSASEIKSKGLTCSSLIEQGGGGGGGVFPSFAEKLPSPIKPKTETKTTTQPTTMMPSKTTTQPTTMTPSKTQPTAKMPSKTQPSNYLAKALALKVREIQAPKIKEETT